MFKRLILGIVVSLLVVGCSSKQATLKIYTVDIPEVKKLAHGKYKTKSIKVMQPQSLKDKINHKMYFSYSPTEQGTYQNSQWSNDLGKILQGSFIQTLQSSHLFKGVVSYASTAQADYRLESTVFAFSHHVRGDLSHAIVSVQFSLVSTNTGKLIKSKRFSYMEPTKTTNAQGYVSATNIAMRSLSNDLVDWLR